jgi:hypothetical protein
LRHYNGDKLDRMVWRGGWWWGDKWLEIRGLGTIIRLF